MGQLTPVNGTTVNSWADYLGCRLTMLDHNEVQNTVRYKEVT